MCWEVLGLVNPACPRADCMKDTGGLCLSTTPDTMETTRTLESSRVPPSNGGLGTLNGCPGASHFASLLLSSTSINGNKIYFTGLIQSSGSQSLVPRPAAAAATCTLELIR